MLSLLLLRGGVLLVVANRGATKNGGLDPFMGGTAFDDKYQERRGAWRGGTLGGVVSLSSSTRSGRSNGCSRSAF